MPKPRVLSMAGVRTRARPLNRDAAALAVAVLVAWPTAVAATDLVPAVTPPALEDVKGAVDRAVEGSKKGLRGSVEAVKRALGGSGGVVGNKRADAPEATGAGPGREAASTGKRSNNRTGQASGDRDQRGDVDELVASGDEIGSRRDEGLRAAPRSEPRAEALPFTGFDPARLSLAGVTLILAGVALLGSAGERRRGRVPAGAG